MLGNLSALAAVLFISGAELVYQAIAAACSSPQTAELNAKARSSTLMKWVHIGLAQAGLLIAISTFIAWRSPGVSWLAPLSGGLLTAIMMYAQYVHALKAGMSSNKPPTEQY